MKRPLLDPSHRENEIATKIIGCAMAVHRHLGPGMLESIYETCLCHELFKSGLKAIRQVRLPIVYDGITFDDPFRIDMVVEDMILVENKALEQVLPLHRAQLRSYLKLANRRLGLLINFNVEMLKEGIHRVVNGEATYDL